MSNNSQRRLRKITQCWKLEVLYKDRYDSWIPLKDLKESYPIELAEYAVLRGIDTEPAFSWWVSHTLKKRERIVMAIKSRLKQVTHKYGIQIPRTIAEVIRFDKENDNKFWTNSIKKEMLNVQVAFDILEDGEQVPQGYESLTVHMIFVQ